MNKQIKKLIIKAGFPKFDEMYVVSDGKELERFAELIVKECIDICYEIDKDYAGEDVLATWCADEIRKRFGVEE